MNTSSRMMSFGEEQKIHVSKVTGDLLPKDFKVNERGQIEVKGKGPMTTCWVEDRVGRSTLIKEEVGGWVRNRAGSTFDPSEQNRRPKIE